MTINNIAWAITGAGHYLAETFNVMLNLVKKHNFKITVFLSAAGLEVVRMYGLLDKLKEVARGGYLSEIFTDDTQGSSYPKSARLARGVYKALVVSPATANTVAKIVNGITDNLVTNAVAHAQKSGTPVIVVPTDQDLGYIETSLPHMVDRDTCKGCKVCSAIEGCKYSAISMVEGKASIDLLKCTGCSLCLPCCPYGAITVGRVIKVKPRKIDLENVERLKRMEGTIVLRNPMEIEEALNSIVKRRA
ncbi:MAG: dihydromethanopterin reductase (acceptor) [Candidatus Nezhaarchaeales archaeon]